ncbi:peptide chain release factor N(5)-glutamine methyltransferase [Candidatus Dependentiae bacterium]|nr:MAG: peptide chain release factor N(5)-glutamine methyltransferase [Candidatus Dependentiae bacterium]
MEQISLHQLVQHISDALITVYKNEELTRSHAWWTVEHVLKKSRTDLLKEDTISVSEQEKKSFEDCVLRIKEHDEPIQYIIGTVPFGSIDLHVEHPILIPRPETEEWVYNFIKECKDNGLDNKNISILDIGTGSGCIALALAYHLPLATVIAVDNNPLAIALAKKNLKKYALSNVHIIESDLFDNIPTDIQFDVIVSNPPYISIEDFLTLEPSVTAWEDCNALVAEDDGFLYLETIAKHALKRLKRSQHNISFPSQLVLEIGHTQAERIAAYAKEIGFAKVWVEKDSFGKDRVMKAK